MASREKIRRVARGKAKKYGVNPDLYEALVRQESNFQERAGSPAGARGPAQLMPATARALGVNPDNPRQNLDGGARYLKQQLDRFDGDVKKALAAYNAGPGAVEKHGGVPPYAETQNYVKRILSGKNARQMRNGRSGSSTTRETKTTTKTIPGVDRSMDRRAAVLSYLGQVKTPTAKSPYGTGRADPVKLAQSIAELQDTPATTKTVRVPGSAATAESASPTSAGGKSHRPFLERAVTVSKTAPPYRWGGGHGPTPAELGTPVDCSGYVSQILGVRPRTSGEFMKYGKPGPGKRVTIYSNPGHVLIKIGNRWFGTSQQNPKGGAGEIARPSAAYLAKFTQRHPPGM